MEITVLASAIRCLTRPSVSKIGAQAVAPASDPGGRRFRLDGRECLNSLYSGE